MQAKIKEIFSNLEDERKAQQATLLSLGALHDISLEEFEARDDDFATKTITISDVRNTSFTLVLISIHLGSLFTSIRARI